MLQYPEARGVKGNQGETECCRPGKKLQVFRLIEGLLTQRREYSKTRPLLPRTYTAVGVLFVRANADANSAPDLLLM